MTDLVVIVPSRGRPHAAAQLAEAFGETRTAASLVFVIDEDDPAYDEYEKALGKRPGAVIDTGGAPSTMVRALNASAVARASGQDAPFAIGFMGDDHRPRTKGWDQAYLNALRDMGTGIVYGNDLFQGERIPTQVAMTSDIIRTLGYMAPPELTHLAVDNWWLALGKAADCIRYLPDVIVEHMHPVAGKAAWDEGYARVNAPEMYRRDLATFERLSREALPVEAARIRALRAGRR